MESVPREAGDGDRQHLFLLCQTGNATSPGVAPEYAMRSSICMKAPREKNSSGVIFDLKRICYYKTALSVRGHMTCRTPVISLDCPSLCQGRELNTVTHFSLLNCAIHVCLNENTCSWVQLYICSMHVFHRHMYTPMHAMLLIYFVAVVLRKSLYAL